MSEREKAQVSASPTKPDAPAPTTTPVEVSVRNQLRVEMWLKGGGEVAVEGDVDWSFDVDGDSVTYVTSKERLRVTLSQIIAVRVESLTNDPIPEDLQRSIGFHA